MVAEDGRGEDLGERIATLEAYMAALRDEVDELRAAREEAHLHLVTVLQSIGTVAQQAGAGTG